MTEMQQNVIVKLTFSDRLNQIPQRISERVEHFFYILGSKIARKPKRWILACFLIILICLSGLYYFRQEKNPLKLWVPPDSDFVYDTEWLMSNFKQGQRIQSIILTGNNILEPDALVKLNEITKSIISAQTSNHQKISWPDVCLKVPVISGNFQRIKRSFNHFKDDFFDEDPGVKMNQSVFEPAVHADTEMYCSVVESLPMSCLLFSILDLWRYDTNEIKKQTKEQIITKLNSVKISPTLGHIINFDDLLGGITKDENDTIISAKAVMTRLIVPVNFSDINMDKLGNDAGTADWATEDVLMWETTLLHTLEKSSKKLTNGKDGNQTLSLWYKTGRSFGDISSSALFQDVDKLGIGIMLMFFYVQLILSNFNWVEWRFCLTAAGLLCVGGAFIIAVGICSMMQVPYGPVHTSLPFMLLGLGMDDLFVMMASWKQIHTYELNRDKPLPERIGLMLGHAGSAICITSLTDVVAFIVGAFTILPTLNSFCIYATVGVLVTFLLQITLFVAFFTLDAERIKQKRNGIIPCIVHKNYLSVFTNPNETRLSKLIHHFYKKIILTVPGKIMIVLITMITSSVAVLGSCQLEQWFDPIWFLPKESYLNKYIAVKHQYYSYKGHDGFIFIGDIDYSSEFPRIISLVEQFSNSSFIESTEPWPKHFKDFVTKFYQIDLTANAVKYEDFQYYLSKFLFSRMGGKYQKNFRFNETLKCGQSAPRILIASIDFSFAKFSAPKEWISAMDNSKEIAKNAGINGFVTVWSEVFGSWVTDKLIAQEVVRNLILALICVMGTTSVLIAELQTCFWILSCVLLTLLNVCGFMYFWGLTIDIVSCIGLELAVGLSVDYASHIAHAFLNAKAFGNGHARLERTLIAVKHIGAAVAYGAGSTLLGLSMMALSQAYVFRAFFKIFFLVIIFGVWHGLFLLPVVLSTIGPRSLRMQVDKKSFNKEPTAQNETCYPLNSKTENNENQ